MSKRYQAAIITATYNGLLVPNAPTIGTATAGAGSASVTFTAPSNVGGGAITSYTAISSPGGFTGTAASSPVTVSGLTNGTAYTFTVVATNTYGSGPASGASNSVTPALNYIEEVFSTWLYTGNDSSQTITNGIDLAGKGGLVWIKSRNQTYSHILSDTNRGTGKFLSSNTSDAQGTDAQDVSAFNAAGFTVGNNSRVNNSSFNYASWTFREQAKFFDIVTYTGDGLSATQVPHSLGSVPGCVIVKPISTTGNWGVWHRANGVTDRTGLSLNGTGASVSSDYGAGFTSTYFTPRLVEDAGYTPGNLNGVTYVAYLFAHNAGGFGLTGTDNVISCGSYTTNGSGFANITLGYEPQWVLIKRTDNTGNWELIDSMRGFTDTGLTRLNANTSGAEEYFAGDYRAPTATGFYVNTNANSTFIYIAIRRGPMKVPTDGTKVFLPVAATTGTQTTGFPIDMMMQFWRTSNDIYANTEVVDRLRGVSSNSTAQSNYLLTTSTGATDSLGAINASKAWTNTGFDVPPAYAGGSNGFECFRRAPGFFDEVCYTGNGSTQTITHNLTVAPELIIAKNRGQAGNNWPVLFNFTSTTLGYGFLNTTTAENNQTYAYVGALASAPTATTFSLVNSSSMNASGYGIVAYLFATCPGVSKVGTYTGTGTTQQINCGFTAGSRFVMIKRIDTSSGDWYVWDSARGIVSGDDPYLLLNSTAAEVTNTDYVDTYSAGFEISSTAPAAINASGGTFIFLAIA
jgi:hypothetical protein